MEVIVFNTACPDPIWKEEAKTWVIFYIISLKEKKQPIFSSKLFIIGAIQEVSLLFNEFPNSNSAI